MRYSTEPRCRKYVKGYGFWSFARKFGNKYGNKLMDTATKTRMGCCKNCIKKSSSRNSRNYRRFNWN